MERKSVILILLALCVLFILEEEVFHFDAFSTRPAATPKNLTRIAPSDQRPPSSVPRMRTVLFSRSRNHYEGNYLRKNGNGRGLEGLVQSEMNRKATDPDSLGQSDKDWVQRTRESEGDEEEVFIDEDDPIDELFEEEEWNREVQSRSRKMEEGENGAETHVDDGDGSTVRLEETIDEQKEADKMEHSPFIYREEEDRQK